MKMKTLLKWTILLLLIGYATWMTLWAGQQAQLRTCQGFDIQVEGNTAMDSAVRRGVLHQLHRYPKPIVGAQLKAINTQKVEDFLASIDNFESVQCMISSDNRLRVDVVPLVPVMRVFEPGKSYYINKDGKRIESKAEFFTDAPVVMGKFSDSFHPRDVIPLVKYISKTPELKSLVSSIVARDNNNLLIVPRIYGHIINFGDTTRLAEKTDALLLFYRKVIPYKGWMEYDTISVKFRGQVVASRRNKAKAIHSESYIEEFDLEEHTLPDAPLPAGSDSIAP